MSYDPSQSQSMSISSGLSPYHNQSPSGMPMQGYRHQSISVHHSPGAAHAAGMGQTSPQHYPFPDQQQSQGPYRSNQHSQQHYQQQSPDTKPQYAIDQRAQPSYPQFNEPVFNFNEAVPIPQPIPFTSPLGNAQAHATTRPPHHPTQQFASWSGYSGPGGAPDTLDEENAIPPNSNPWNIDAK